MFGNEGIVSTQDDRSNPQRVGSLGEFLDLWDGTAWGSRPFKKFYLHSWKFQAGDLDQERFLDLVGGHITSLTLDNCSFVGVDNFKRIIYEALPKLQFLKIYECKVDKAYRFAEIYEEPVEIQVETLFGARPLNTLDISNCHPHSLAVMVSHFHKLKSLRMGSNTGKEYQNLLETIKLNRAQDPTILPLKKFDVNCVFELGGQRTASSIALLKLHDQLNLQLQRLEIQLSYSEGGMGCNFKNEDVIRTLLQYRSATLKQLVLNGKVEEEEERIVREWRLLLLNSFPFGLHFENLEQLDIPASYSNSLNFLRYTPNLRALDISCYGFIDEEPDNFVSTSSQLEIGGWTMPSLTDLKFNFPLADCNWGKLMKWMPNVEILSWVQLDDVKFSMVSENWKNMKALRDSGEELTDEGVIGTGTLQDAGGNEETQREPNITKLKNLTTFSTNSSKPTSAFVHEGFLKLANLKELWLDRSTKLDDEAKAALKRRNIKSNIYTF